MALRYPVYIPSKGRADNCITADILTQEGVPFFVVVEPQDYTAYCLRYGNSVIMLPQDNHPERLAFARNFIKDHAAETKALKHWQLDDDIQSFNRVVVDEKTKKKKGVRCLHSEALEAGEKFVDGYENIGIAGFCSNAFGMLRELPYAVNQVAYSCVILDTNLPHRYRNIHEDTDYSLQVLSSGRCTVLFTNYLFTAPAMGTVAGGMSDIIYNVSEGRLKLARGLQRAWPHLGIKIVRVKGAPRFNLAHIWRRFDTKLKKIPTLIEAESEKILTAP